MLAVLFSTLVLAAADPAPAPPAAAESAPPAKPPEKVCRNIKPTGSHFIERVC